MRRVIADNLAAHHVGGVQQLIEAAGATLRYLPALRATRMRNYFRYCGYSGAIRL